jgi:hypothetical protein
LIEDKQIKLDIFSNLRQSGGFLQELSFPPPIRLVCQ